MRQRGTGRGGILEWEPILLVDENVFDGAIAIRAEPLGTVTGGVESIGAIEPAQSHEPQARAVPLLGMRPVREDARDHPPGGWATLFGPRDEPGRGPFRVRPMGPRHVIE